MALLLGAAVNQAAATGITATGTADVAGKHYTFTAPAECTYTGSGSIYDVPAAIWHASLSTAGGNPLSRINATIFQTSAAAPQANVHLTIGSLSYEISTVRGGWIKGAVTAKGEHKGAGGVLTFEGKTASGQPLLLVIACSAFAKPEDNG